MADIDRSGCSATVHGTVDAYKRLHCRCPDARAKAQECDRRYRHPYLRGNRDRTLRHRDVDEVVVLRVVRGDPLPLGVEERRIAIAQLTARQLSAFQIAQILGCTTRTVTRVRAYLRERAA